MKNRGLLTVIFAAGFLFGSQIPAFSEMTGVDPRDAALDRTLGGMEEGSRILSPHGDVHGGGRHTYEVPGSHVGSAAEPHTAAAPASPAGGGEMNHGVFVHGSSGSDTGVAGTEASGSSGRGQESVTGGGGGSESGTIEVDADANLETDDPGAGGQEPASSGENSIIEAEIGANVSEEGADVNADVGIDPNASGGLVDADAATSTDVVEQELVSDTGLEVDNGADTTAAETISVGTETGSTAVPATSEVEGGVEADVEGVGAGDDIACNEADGLPCTTPLL